MPKFASRLSKTLRRQKPAAEATPSFGVGTVVNARYRLDAELGRGGMGIVYRAYDIPNERNVAVKLINAKTANALALGQFQREAEISAQLRHPHIVTFYEVGSVDVGAADPAPFIVMELLSGKSLADIIELTYARIIDIARQVCEALQYVHEKGFVYRDLKPGNVQLERQDFRYRVKLIDFGLARPRGAAYLPNESSLAGSFFYLAPELINGNLADVASDLYALGITLYEMITGRVPFSNFDEQSVLEQHLEEPAAPPSDSQRDIPPALNEIVMRLLEKDPRRRYASAREVYNALGQVQIGDGSAARGNLLSVTFSGRNEEIAQVIQLLETNQLVTLLNEDETLALAVGARLQEQFADGVWVADIGAVSGPTWVLETIALTLGVREDRRRGLTLSLIEHLREKNMLLILDRCDQLLHACAQFAETILRTCPEVYIVITARQA